MAKKKQFESMYSGYVYEKPVTYWTATEDVKKHLTKVDLTRDGDIQAGGLPIISDGKTAYIDTADGHTAIIATSGMMKSICGFMPLIRTLAQSEDLPENMVITDPKGELFQRTSGYLKSRNYRVFCLDFRTMDKDCFNLMRHPAEVYRSGETDKGLSLLSDIVNALAEPQRQKCKDIFWPDCAALWLNGTGSLMLDAYPKIEQVNVQNWSNFNVRKAASMVEDRLLPRMPDNITKAQLEQCCSSAENTFRSILITATSFLSMFNQNPRLAAMLSHSTFTLEDLVKPKTALYLVTDDTTSTADSILGMIISQIQTFLVDNAYHSSNGKLPCRVNFILDEFASLPLPNFDKALATHRSRDIKYYLCIQSLALLEKRYDKPELLLSNCASTLYLGSTELPLLTELEAKLGKTNITPDGSEKPLCSRAELMNLGKSWTHKEAIYMNLQENIRYCTKLPAIEAYDMGDELVLTYSKNPPDVQVYTVSQFVSDVIEEKIRAPFAEKPKRKTVPQKRNKKNSVQPSSADEISDITQELIKKFDDLFGPIDDDD